MDRDLMLRCFFRACWAAFAVLGTLLAADSAASTTKLDLGNGSIIRFSTPAPVLSDGEQLPTPEFDDTGTAKLRGLMLRRTIESVPGGYRLKLSVTNNRDQPLRLRRLVPLSVERQEDCLIAGTTVSAWNVFRLARHKNDVPGPFRPTVVNDASREAATDNSRATNSTDDASAGNRGFIRYHSDPGMVFMPDDQPESRHLFIGFAGQSEHLSDVCIEMKEGLSALARITAAAEFDGVVVPSGGSRETHALYVVTGKSRQELLGEHVDRISFQYGSRIAKLRNVFCTWYFYGPEILASDLRADLAALKRRPVAFDLFLIDYNWDDKFGDWNANLERFPAGMKAMADEILAGGFVPGIWSCPFLIEQNAAILKRYPDLPLKNRAGEYLKFEMTAMETCFILDPTAPSAEAFLTELCQRFTGWGYRYLKFDFLRAIVIHEDAAFHDPTQTRAQAYRRATQILRRAAGPDTMIGVWGGLYEANAGFVDINRSGSDVRGHWDAFGEYPHHTRYPVRMRQTFARSFYDEKLWTSDQDALQLRRRDKPWRGARPHLTMGKFTDEEAFSLVVYRFLGGGVVQVSDKLDELDQDRYDLFKSVIPTYAPVAQPLDRWDEYLPEKFASHFSCHPSLPPWSVVSFTNWNENSEKRIGITPSEIPGLKPAPKYAAFEYRSQRFLGTFGKDDRIEMSVPAHGARVIRLTALTSDGTYLIGTDLNLSSGMEIEAMSGESVELKLAVRNHPAQITLLDWKAGKSALRTIAHTPKK